MNRRRTNLLIGMGGLLAASAMVLTTQAKADPMTDFGFIRSLDEAGINYSSPQSAIELAHGICTDMVGGSTLLHEQADVWEATRWRDWSFDDSITFVLKSVETYCITELEGDPLYEDFKKNNPPQRGTQYR